ncbi:hypothetical protein GGX14DRAFT_406665 [Mycena pura]|uniref:Uncharacterized protein n=1 Tax=Mycena pura TaxID=153505 RepID=A0AAD6Y595_9AGAR|nr:hypothetical protein GGX14DRAFT_406665 [Mycena pura]
MLDDAQLIKFFPPLIKALKKRIKSLPHSIPLGDDADGPLVRYLGDYEVDAEEGAAYSANRQWERAFQVSEEEQRRLIVRGPYGLDLVCPFLEFFAEQPGMKGKDGVESIRPELAAPVVVPAAQFFKPRPKAVASGPTALIPAKRGPADDDDPTDKSYKPPKKAPDLSEEDSDVEEVSPPVKTNAKTKAGKGQEMAVESDNLKAKSRQHNDDSEDRYLIRSSQVEPYWSKITTETMNLSSMKLKSVKRPKDRYSHNLSLTGRT